MDKEDGSLIIKDDLGHTPLLSAAYVGNCKTMVYLLSKTNVNPLELDSEENTILHLACDSGDQACALRLLDLAKERNFIELLLSAVNVQGQTALHLAAKRGLENVIELLLQLKVPANVEDKNGLTPSLYIAKDRASLGSLVAIESYAHYEHVQHAIEQYDEWLNSTQANTSPTIHSRSSLNAMRKSVSSMVTPNEQYSQRVKRLSLISHCDNKQQISNRGDCSKNKSNIIAVVEATSADIKDETSTSQIVDSDPELY